MAKITIDKAVKSMVPKSTSYGKMLEHAINAINMSSIGSAPADADALFRMRLAQECTEEVNESLIAVVMTHAKLQCAEPKE